MSNKEKLSKIYDNTIGKKIDNFDGRYEAYKKYDLDSFKDKYINLIEGVLDKLGIVLSEEKEAELLNHIFNGYQKLVLVNPDYKLEKEYVKRMCINFHMLNTPNPLFELIRNVLIGGLLLFVYNKLAIMLWGDPMIISDLNALILYSTYAIIIYSTFKNSKFAYAKYLKYKDKMNRLNWTIV